ncbi:MAG: transcriptional regulator [Actinophytocola sp.]|uniref:winged helix-turn-helix transcriptional regulator n=1 Tax=Actinophytocola sp. TaxID=1872138 RepID=UPI00132B4757|nr:helix-turn-helix domain-containing protein [Actinophytocola sp.]MPZ79116.1 transcriptional regulator [Actinophytocola sp.]
MREYSCGLDAAIDVVGGKWKPLILWALHAHGPCRFGELRRLVSGITEKMLIQQLRQMEADGLVHREVYRQVPPRVDYSMTDYGASLNTALLPLGEWGERNMARIESRERG